MVASLKNDQALPIYCQRHAVLHVGTKDRRRGVCQREFKSGGKMKLIEPQRHYKSAVIVALATAMTGCAPMPVQHATAAPAPIQLAPADPCPHPTSPSGDTRPDLIIEDSLANLFSNNGGDLTYWPVYPLCGSPSTITWDDDRSPVKLTMSQDGRPLRIEFDGHKKIFSYDASNRVVRIDDVGTLPMTQIVTWESPTKIHIRAFEGKRKLLAGDVELNVKTHTLWDEADIDGTRTLYHFDSQWNLDRAFLRDKNGKQPWSQDIEYTMSWLAELSPKGYAMRFWTTPPDGSQSQSFAAISYLRFDDHGNPSLYRHVTPRNDVQPVHMIQRTITYW
jgi:hypothetical protein